MTDYTYSTGNPVGSTDVRDGVDNLKSFDVFMNAQEDEYNQRDGVISPTVRGAIKALGPVPVDFTFTTGGTFTSRNQAAKNPPDGNWYGWVGDGLPHVVAPGADPTLPGSGYVPRTDVVLRKQVREALRRSYADAGLTLVSGSFEEGGTLTGATDVLLYKANGKAYSGPTGAVSAGTNPTSGGFVDRSGSLLFSITYSDSVEAKNATTDFNIIIGDKPLPVTASKRDGVQVSRDINGKTDCHAFADKTNIQSVSDGGTYGTFDATTVISHGSAQSHLFAYQDRTSYDGGGTLGTWGNIVWPEMNGAGVVTQRTDIEIKDVAGSGGVINSHIGLHIRNLARANSNVAINLGQVSGFSIYANGGAPMYHQGDAGFGVVPSTGAPIDFRGSGSTTGLLSSDDTNGAFLGVIGDKITSLWTNGAARLVCRGSGLGYPVTPGADNSQKLGNGSYRWAEIFSGNSTINTSDAREKTDPLDIDDAVLDAWGDVRLVAFKWLNAVHEKGDSARWHFGVIAQQVRDAFLAHGIDGTAYGLLCYDEWGDEYQYVTDEAGNYTGEKIKVVAAGNRWGVRSSQCLFLEAAYQRRRCDRIEARLSAAGL